MSDGENIFAKVDKEASIVDVVSFYLGSNELKAKGKEFATRCPFHDDHSPSMLVDPSKNIYKCFACGAGGGPIKFVKEYAHLGNKEALIKVAEIAHIQLPDEFKKADSFLPTINQKYAKELAALKDLHEFYTLSIKSKEGTEFAIKYLKDRNIDEDVVKHFEIGYAPIDDKKAIEYLRKKGYEISTLTKAGILANSSTFSDRFSKRIIFPIHDRFGNIVGFSGRKIDNNNEAKYINYTDTALFKKSEILYHYHKAKESAKKDKVIYIVEGFMDAIAIQRCGINSVVATMGTALTSEHIQMLKKLGVEVRLFFDGDEAGQLATERALPLLLDNEVKFNVVRKLKGAKDCDEYLSKNGSNFLLKALNNIYDPFLFLLARALKGRKEITDNGEISSFLSNSSKYFKSLNSIYQESDLNILVKVTHLSLDTLKNYLNKEIPIEDKKINKDEKKQTKTYSRKNAFQRREQLENLVENVSLDNEYQIGDLISEIVNIIKNSNLVKGFSKEVIESESNLIIVLPFSRNAFKAFQEARCNFIIHFLYCLSEFINMQYSLDLNMLSLNKDAFVRIDSLIDQQFEKKESIINNIDTDAFDLEGLDDDMPDFNLNLQEKDIIKKIVSLLAKISEINPNMQTLNLNNIERLASNHQNYIKRDNEINKFKEENPNYTKAEINAIISKYRIKSRIK